MKNNQFKKLIRIKFEAKAQKDNLHVHYVDISNNERMFYIYDKDYSSLGTINLFLNASGFHIKGSSSPSSVVKYDNILYEAKGSYLEIKKAFKVISDLIDYVGYVIELESLAQD